MPQLKNVQINKDILTFTLEDVPSSFANALRRIFLAEIPTFSPDEFIVEKNTSPFTKEFITNRIGLIPVLQKNINNVDTLSLIAAGKHNDIIEIMSDQIVPKNILSPTELIVKLKGNSEKIEEFNVKFKLIKGTPQKNAKWACCTIATYIIENVDKIDNPPKNNKFNFTVESRGVFETKKLLPLAFKVMEDKLKIFKEALNNPDSDKVIVKLIINNFYLITIENEDHTLGNLLTNYIQLYKSKEYIGYRKAHPLEEIIEIKLVTDKPYDLLNNTADDLLKIITNMK